MLTKGRPPGERQTGTFFLLFKYTAEGIRSVKRQSRRTRRASQIVQAAGGTCRFYLTVAGPYDMISVVEGLDDRSLAKLVLALNAVGTVETTVVKTLGFHADEYAKFLSELP